MQPIAKYIGPLTLAGCTAIGGLATAAEPGWYVGASAGAAQAAIDAPAINQRLLGAGASSVTLRRDERDTAYKVLLGYRVSSLLSFEAGYFNLGEFTYAAQTVPAGSESGRVKVSGANLDVLGSLPIIDGFSLFARAGINHGVAKDSFATSGAVAAHAASANRRSANYKVGVGGQFDLTPALALRLEVERYRIDDATVTDGDLDFVSAGLVYHFGRRAPERPMASNMTSLSSPPAAPPILLVVAATPRSVAPTPTPPPAPVPKVAVAFATDSFYQFDTATLTQTGKNSLDRFAADLKGIYYEVITVVGHTDRFGTHAYNQTLSESRAVAVKAYLVEFGGLPANKIYTRGAEESQPLTLPGTCVGEVATRQMIECLQSDRRVEVDVKVTQPAR